MAFFGRLATLRPVGLPDNGTLISEGAEAESSFYVPAGPMKTAEEPVRSVARDDRQVRSTRLRAPKMITVLCEGCRFDHLPEERGV
jgi:hypothetical protein